MEQIMYNLLTYLIIAAAVIVMIKKVYEKLNPKKTSSQGGCNSGCGGCTTQCDLKEVISKAKK